MVTNHSVSYRPKLEVIASKVIDDELIIVRLSDGTYYSMRNVGTRIWELIEAGHDLRDIVRTLADWYDKPIDQVASDVESIVKVLLEEELIAVTPQQDNPGAAIPAESKDSPSYETPQVDIYRDMGNLLALDPPTPGIDELVLRRPKHK